MSCPDPLPHEANVKLKFTKMHGAGNDFVVVDATRAPLALDAAGIRRLSDRHLGIGFDQMLVVEPARNRDTDFYYRIFNADGGEVSQCDRKKVGANPQRIVAAMTSPAPV